MYWNPFDSAHSGQINASDGRATILRFTSGRSLVGCGFFFLRLLAALGTRVQGIIRSPTDLTIINRSERLSVKYHSDSK